jgi:hypothetical protein
MPLGHPLTCVASQAEAVLQRWQLAARAPKEGEGLVLGYSAGDVSSSDVSHDHSPFYASHQQPNRLESPELGQLPSRENRKQTRLRGLRHRIERKQ